MPARDFRNIPVEELTPVQAEAELARLAAKLAEHDERYYQEDAPTISDSEYDALRQRNNAIEARFPDLRTLFSPSFLVGSSPKKGFKKIQHAAPLYSLDNAFDDEDVKDFVDRVRKFLKLSTNEDIAFTAEPKIDGLSMSLRYEEGVLVTGATRGNKITGEDVTANVLTIDEIPQKLKVRHFPDVCEVRGEIYLTRKDFFALNKRQATMGDESFANPRNAAAGSVRQKNPSVTASRSLKFFAYGWGQMSAMPSDTQTGMVKWLKKCGFRINPLFKVCKSVESMLDTHREIETKRATLGYDIDGVVYKVDRLDWQSRLGFGTRFPRWAIAHKFSAEKAITTLEDIYVQVGRTGALTPVAKLKPVTVGGVVVQNVTLHNEAEIARLDLRIGDTVTVQRAGDVIPQILGVVKDKPRGKKRYPFPKVCPCHLRTPVAREATAAGHEGAVARCTGEFACPYQRIEHLRHFVSRQAFDIDGLGEKQIAFFFEKGWVNEPADIFTLEERNEEIRLEEQEGFGPTSVGNLFAAIDSRREISLERFIISLGIRHVGETTAPALARTYGSWKSFHDAAIGLARGDDEVRNEIDALDQIGDTVIDSLSRYFREKHNLGIVERLTKQVRIRDAEKPATNSPVSGKTIVFSGKLEKLTRDEAKAQAVRLGARVSGSVSKKTDYVVAGPGAGSKLTEAKDLGVEVLTEDEWLKLVGN